MIKLTRSKTEFTDSETGEVRKIPDRTVYLNPTYIKRIQRSHFGDTVIEVHGERFATWCKESPDEVYALIKGEV